MAKSAPNVARTALALLPVQIVFRGGEAALPLLLSAWYGRSEATDVYYLLASWFTFVGALVVSAFQDSAVLPILMQVEHEQPREYPRVTAALLGHALTLAATLGVALGGAAAIAAAWFLTGPLRLAAIGTTVAFATLLSATSLRAFLVGLMQARGAFFAHPLASGPGIVLAIATIAALRGPLGIAAIPLGLLVGEVFASVLLVTMLRRREAKAPTDAPTARLWPSLDRPAVLQTLFVLAGSEVIGGTITRINPVVDQAMAVGTDLIGGGTLLRYANEVASLPTSLAQATVLTVLLARLSMEARVDRAAFVQTVVRACLVLGAVLAGLSLVVFGVRGVLLPLLFLHGEMDATGVSRMSDLVPWTLLSVVPFGTLLVLARAHVALRNSRIMIGMGILNASANALLNFPLRRVLGLRGLALSTALTYVVVSVVFALLLPSALRRFAATQGDDPDAATRGGSA